ncbi:MAG: 30S ribosomal protein S2, partial [Hyphomonadaceae bacterium]|nr:30S ribosomal protein S2 [Hyphomonadaceae bacterium]
VSNSIKQLRELNTMFDGGGGSGLTKKELLDLQRRRDKLQRALGGIADMGGLPAAIIVIDTNKEAIAILEARKLNIPVIAILDTNCDPDGITYPVPANDDAGRAITLYCELFAKARSTARSPQTMCPYNHSWFPSCHPQDGQCQCRALCPM